MDVLEDISENDTIRMKDKRSNMDGSHVDANAMARMVSKTAVWYRPTCHELRMYYV